MAPFFFVLSSSFCQTLDRLVTRRGSYGISSIIMRSGEHSFFSSSQTLCPSPPVEVPPRQSNEDLGLRTLAFRPYWSRLPRGSFGLFSPLLSTYGNNTALPPFCFFPTRWPDRGPPRSHGSHPRRLHYVAVLWPAPYESLSETFIEDVSLHKVFLYLPGVPNSGQRSLASLAKLPPKACLGPNVLTFQVSLPTHIAKLFFFHPFFTCGFPSLQAPTCSLAVEKRPLKPRPCPCTRFSLFSTRCALHSPPRDQPVLDIPLFLS